MSNETGEAGEIFLTNFGSYCHDALATASCGKWAEGRRAVQTPFRVLRGASWNNNDSVNLRSTYRNNEHPTNRNDNNGFRLVVSVRNAYPRRSGLPGAGWGMALPGTGPMKNKGGNAYAARLRPVGKPTATQTTRGTAGEKTLRARRLRR